PAPRQFLEDQFELVPRHRFERFVFNGPDLAPILEVSHGADERNRGPHPCAHPPRGDQRRFIDALLSDPKSELHRGSGSCQLMTARGNVQPPCTGGKSETASPSFNTWSWPW